MSRFITETLDQYSNLAKCRTKKEFDDVGYDNKSFILCKAYYILDCDGCPVATSTGYSKCCGSPRFEMLWVIREMDANNILRDPLKEVLKTKDFLARLDWSRQP